MDARKDTACQVDVTSLKIEANDVMEIVPNAPSLCLDADGPRESEHEKE